MSTWELNALGKTPMRLFRKFQYWRAMRMYRRVVALHREAEALVAEADRLIGQNVKPPMPLFDRLDSEGR